MNTILNNNNKNQLVKILRNCDHSHKHCVNIVEVANKNFELLTQNYLDEFLSIIKPSTNICCLSQYNNKKSTDIKNFIIKCSEKFIISTWDAILTFMWDDDIYTIIKNQYDKNNELIDKFINTEITTGYGSRMNILNCLCTHPIKKNSFEYVIKLMTLQQFSIYLNKLPKNNNHYGSISLDDIVIKFILNNKENFKNVSNKHIGLKIINNYITKPNIIKTIYELISKHLNLDEKRDILNKSISLYDKNIILILLENKDIIPDINTINKLVEKSYRRSEGSAVSKTVADIIDLLCEYGLVIDKKIIIKLLEHGCYVNNLEKHGLKVDNEILAKCAEFSFYPYAFDIKPNIDILIKECSKPDNLLTIKKLKEFGGTYTSECLEEACKISRNGKVIKFLINECNVIVNDKCIEKFTDTNKLESLDVLVKQYKLHNPNKNKQTDTQINKNTLNLDQNSTMKIEPKKLEFKIDTNNNDEYELKNKVKDFFQYKKNIIKYQELYQLFLKYLIDNKLVIGNYFVINQKLSNLLKLNTCLLINTNQIHNVLTYFLKLPKNNV